MIEESELSGLGRWVREHRNDPPPTSTVSPRLSSRRTRFRKLRRVGTSGSDSSSDEMVKPESSSSASSSLPPQGFVSPASPPGAFQTPYEDSAASPEPFSPTCEPAAPFCASSSSAVDSSSPPITLVSLLHSSTTTTSTIAPIALHPSSAFSRSRSSSFSVALPAFGTDVAAPSSSAPSLSSLLLAPPATSSPVVPQTPGLTTALPQFTIPLACHPHYFRSRCVFGSPVHIFIVIGAFRGTTSIASLSHSYLSFVPLLGAGVGRLSLRGRVSILDFGRRRFVSSFVFFVVGFSHFASCSCGVRRSRACAGSICRFGGQRCNFSSISSSDTSSFSATDCATGRGHHQRSAISFLRPPRRQRTC